MFLGLQSVGYFSCFVENPPNIKILNSQRSQTNTAKHIPENRRRIQIEEEESKIQWKAIVTTTTQWNNKNDYLNIYIWLEDHCVILDINRIINGKKKRQNKQKTVVHILETVLKKNSLESNDCTCTVNFSDYRFLPCLSWEDAEVK